MTAVAGLGGCTREDLAVLVREYLLAGHLIDRAGMPQVIGDLGVEAMSAIAIDEWMGASPVYTRRMQRLLGFTGDDVATIFKGMQLDIGAPPQFLDFRYQVHDAHHGEFQLASCGALMDVEPMGEELVHAMCHHIEDPTFDATAWATNPRARMRPLHRPPRVPADRHPHCHWTVEIVPDAEPLPEPAVTARIAASRAAGLPLPEIDPDDPGQRDYRGPLVADVRFEELSRSALAAVVDEVCLQGQLLAMSFMGAVADRAGGEVATSLGLKQLTGIAGLTAGRLRDALGLGRSLAEVATVVELHPALLPRAYVDARVELAGDGELLVVALGPCPALEEEATTSWPALLRTSSVPLEAIVQAVEPRARVRALEPPPGGAELAWEVTVDPAAEPAVERDEVLLTRFSTGADFRFEER